MYIFCLTNRLKIISSASSGIHRFAAKEIFEMCDIVSQSYMDEPWREHPQLKTR
jgi:hypothetical protein